MDVLIRRFHGEPYVWTKAKFINGKIMVDNTPIPECNIVSIRNDIRKRYVRCSVCGTYFKKGSKKIEQHKQPCTDTHLCFGCEYLRQRVKVQKSQKYELLENGNYISKNKSEVFLSCLQTYGESINSQRSRDACVYNKCQNATMKEVNGFFLNYPGAFDNIITTDKILECGYKDAWNNDCDNTTHYQLKARNTIVAVVNNLNIVECFDVSYKRHEWTVFYSKKYNELYTPVRGGGYQVWRSYNIDADVRARIKEKIASLYE